MLLNAFALFLYVSTIGADRYNWSYPLDLSHTLDENTLTWNPEYNFSLVDKLVIDNPPNFYAANNFVGPEHGGTHLDAPYHFNKKGWKLHEIPLNHLLSPGILVNVSNKVNDNPDFELLPEHLEEWQQNYGAIPKGVIVLVDFGWSKHYGDKLRYFGNTTSPYNFPGISEPGARLFVNHGGIHGVGLDTPSLDVGKSKSFPAHGILLGAHIFGLENVAFNGIHLPPKGFFLITLPMKITNGTGAPCRIVAVLPKSVKFNP